MFLIAKQRTESGVDPVSGIETRSTYLVDLAEPGIETLITEEVIDSANRTTMYYTIDSIGQRILVVEVETIGEIETTTIYQFESDGSISGKTVATKTKNSSGRLGSWVTEEYVMLDDSYVFKEKTERSNFIYESDTVGDERFNTLEEMIVKKVLI